MVNKFLYDFRFLLLAAAVAFIYIQMRLFTTQSEYADRLAAAVEAETRCTSQMRKLIDQISMQESRIVELEVKGLQRCTDKIQTQVAAVVIVACNRADYLERTIKSILNYQNAVASKYPLYVSQDGSDPQVRKKASSYDQLTYMQHLDSKPVQNRKAWGVLIAYSTEIAPDIDFFCYCFDRFLCQSHARSYQGMTNGALDELFHKHNLDRVNHA
ncbi:alpha-1,3-mannosyl-glycoprotein 2-beta-N-acetylglucosaminyltransferase-like [Syzygium oleosum]|uniref:alpha-1,3-mannosyl-glycoprotein 2-beta-N-acetylglucosaminyltransferase-like n=1 Tax=Syzygium oleosum TaxID=219896 RepID=UPI0024BAD44A|nr:alpha-1,3-mannosyl-glycoprotein 2-beta-N-acetylglucosaminyltransferase-like [Syzygium oleosum]XP_056164060.1 alpha-1,3-mannosyl-glycoprotein 2-beta-N-acetylglucosaminyltransferase-like [Syzygium oleosum]